ncbi:hypothetical protein [Alteromonas sp. a30]|uniref:hypothetical protein n=1 Tax=Alteromonas sp. a30 TaxID=2730917 RepID=UPI002281FDCF|nr:hypothetical protein [Alteromonas sp. a30]MCY7296002.1 hypothetical protein [Alteromonas sp. a30]
MPNSPKQTTIFGTRTPRQAFYAELCNALYDKSIQEVAEIQLPPKLLQQRLASLTYHVNLATEKLLNCYSPLELDVHNGSWQGSQASTLKIDNVDSEKTLKWLEKNAAVGLNLPVYIGQTREQHIELDVVDKVDHANQKLRLNKNGWFAFNGSPIAKINELAPSQEANTTLLLKPSKAFLTAAVCGHCWNYTGKTIPRRLPLRELLLSTSIDWKTYKLTK